MDHPIPPVQGGLSPGSDAIDALQQLLTTGDEADRCHASRALGAIGYRSAVPALIERLRDDDIDVCIDAAAALGQIGDPMAVGALLDVLRNEPNGEVQTAVIDALGHLADEQLVEPLLELAQRRPETLAWDDDEGWDPWWDMRRRAVTILGQLRIAEAAPILVDILNDRDSEDIEDETMRALALIGSEGEAILVRQLRQGNPRQRRRAVRALGNCGTPSAWKAVLRSMKDSEPEVRAAAVRAFGSHPEIARFLQLLLALLRDRHDGVRQAVLEVVAGLRVVEDQVPVAVEQVMPLLADSSPRVRATAIDTLRAVMEDMRERFDQRALDEVRTLVDDEDDDVTASACAFLAGYGTSLDVDVLFTVLCDTQREPRARRAAALAIGEVADPGHDTIDGLTGALGDASQPVRLAALTALKRLHDRSPGGVQSSSPSNTEQPAVSVEPESDAQPATPLQVIIGVLGGDVLLSHVPEEDPVRDDVDNPPSKPVADNIRGESEAPTGEHSDIGQEPADQPTPVDSTLEAIMRDNRAVAQALGSARATESGPVQPADMEEGLEEYLELVEQNRERSEARRRVTNVSIADDIRRLSARILGESDDPAAIAALIDSVNDDDPQLRRDAADSLAAIAQRGNRDEFVRNAYGALVTHLLADERDVRLACARALGRLRLSRTITPLLTCLDDEDVSVRTQAVYSLAELFDRPPLEPDHKPLNRVAVIDGLRKGLSDPEPAVRKAVAEVLGGLDQGDAVASIVQAAFVDDGGQARDLGRALRKFSNQTEVSEQLLRALNSSPDSSHRRIVIEMIEEVSKQQVTNINQLSGV